MPILKPAIVSPGAPQQHGQPSRKGKSSWRKNVDISEIQEGLTNVREEIAAGGIIAEKESADLFTLDTDGDADIPRKFLRTSKRLRADEIISQRSPFPIISSRKRSLIKSMDDSPESKRHRVAYVSHKELIRLRNVANGYHSNEGNVEEGQLSSDLWDLQPSLLVDTQKDQFSFLPKPQMIKAPKTLRRKPISLTASGKHTRSVMIPDGAYSYNPAYIDYEERLRAEGDKELRREQKRLATAEAKRLEDEAVSRSVAEAEVAQAKSGLSECEEDSVWEGFESSNEETKLKMKQPKRKTQAQSNRIKKRKEEERKAKTAANIKKKNEQVAQIRKIVEEMKAKRKALPLTIVQDDGSSECDDLELRRRKLGNIALPEKQLELVLPDELQESLRLLKPEGNLLRDRYRSFLVRGKLECRRRTGLAKKARTKSTEKWAHKDFMLH